MSVSLDFGMPSALARIFCTAALALPSSGVAVTATGHDTLAATEDFFSYRRNTLSGVRDYGRGLSAIALGR